MALVGPLPPALIVLAPSDATASIGVDPVHPASVTPSSGDAAYSQIQALAPTYQDRLNMFATYQSVDNYIPPTPQPSSMDIYRRKTLEGGDGIRLAKNLNPDAIFTDFTPASGVDYEYRATSYAAINNTSAAGSWNGAIGTPAPPAPGTTPYPAPTLYPSTTLYPAPA